jgi:hypothetical protein
LIFFQSHVLADYELKTPQANLSLSGTIVPHGLTLSEEVRDKDSQRFETIITHLDQSADKVIAHLDQSTNKVFAHLDQTSEKVLTALTSTKTLVIGLTVIGSLILLILSVMFCRSCLRKNNLRIIAQGEDMEGNSDNG